MKKYILLSTLVLTACAKTPDKIKAQYVSPMVYQSWTCNQLIEEHNRLIRHLNDAYAAQKKSANNDKINTTVGVLLFWPSLFFLGDDARAEEYARIKGEFNALEQAMVRNNCNISLLERPKLN